MKFKLFFVTLMTVLMSGCVAPWATRVKKPVQPNLPVIAMPAKIADASLHQTNDQLTMIPLPDPLPSVGNLVGRNSNYTNPAYGNLILRCTDVLTDASNKQHFSWEISDSGGGNEICWNADQTMLRIMAADSGASRIVGFDQASMTCTVANSYSSTAAGATWNHSDPRVDYTMSGTVVSKRVFDVANKLGPPVISQLFDFRSCAGLVAMGKVQWSGQLSTDETDDAFVSSFSDRGNQNTGEYVAVYTLSTNQCTVWNTLTGQVTGPASTAQISTFYPFTIHDATEYPGGVTVVSIGTCDTCPQPHSGFLWQAGTLTANLITKQTGGHSTLGYKTFINLTASPKMAARQFDNVNVISSISSNKNVHFPNPQDTHLSWQDVDPLDTAPIFATQVSIGQAQPLKIATPLQNEMFAVDPTNGEFIRIVNTMTSGIANPFNFRSQYAIMSAGMKCEAWSADWFGMLGNTDGKTSTCVLGQGKPNECRSDVFITCPK